MKRLLFKRFIAYIIDVLIITLISTILGYFIMSKTSYKEYIELTKEYETKYMNILNSKDSNLEELEDLSYRLEKSNITVKICNIVSLLGYFGIYQFISGNTIGKRLMKFKVVNIKKKQISIHQYFIRSIINNRLLSSSVLVIILLTTSKSTFLHLVNYINTPCNFIYFISVLLVIFRKDNRGLHDLIAGTKVVSSKEVNNG